MPFKNNLQRFHKIDHNAQKCSPRHVWYFNTIFSAIQKTINIPNSYSEWKYSFRVSKKFPFKRNLKWVARFASRSWWCFKNLSRCIPKMDVKIYITTLGLIPSLFVQYFPTKAFIIPSWSYGKFPLFPLLEWWNQSTVFAKHCFSNENQFIPRRSHEWEKTSLQKKKKKR